MGPDITVHVTSEWLGDDERGYGGWEIIFAWEVPGEPGNPPDSFHEQWSWESAGPDYNPRWTPVLNPFADGYPDRSVAKKIARKAGSPGEVVQITWIHPHRNETVIYTFKLD